MSELNNFVSQSKSFGGFMFVGSFDIYTDFLKMYDIFLSDKINLLDDYANFIYLKWEKTETNPFAYDYEKCNKYEESISNLRRFKIVDQYELAEQRDKLKCFRQNYQRFLESKNQQPRIKACQFTSKKEIRIAVFELHGKRCLCCGSETNITIDHVVPVKKGGINELSNMQPLCKSCNSRKSTSIIDYR